MNMQRSRTGRHATIVGKVLGTLEGLIRGAVAPPELITTAGAIARPNGPPPKPCML